MDSLYYDRIAVLDYLKASVVRMRHHAKDDPSQLGRCLWQAAEEISADTVKLEASLRAAGYFPQVANEP